jgi:serine phosphatase RsbU (regulator of sigma subunit)
MERFAYPCARHSLRPGDTLCVVTDGITEAMDRGGGFYGVERLKAVISKNPEIIAVREDVQRFTGGAEQADDVTLLCLRWNGPR